MAIKLLFIFILAAINIQAENVEQCDLKKQGEEGYFADFNKCVEAKKEKDKKDQFVDCIEKINNTKNADGTFNKNEIPIFLNAMKYSEPKIRTDLETAFNACANNSTMDGKAVISCQTKAANKICKCDL